MPTQTDPKHNAEAERLASSESREADWKNWGPYVSERAWGTVREDYSESGDAWSYFPHEHARSRAFRWNEDGLAAFCNRFQNLCLGLAVWNEKDPYLKERLYGLNGHEGNHGEDVKEYYFYLDGTPTHSYMKMLYKYPQVEYPYERLLAETKNAREPTGNTSSSTRLETTLNRAATSISSSSMRRSTRKTFSARSPWKTAGQPLLLSIFCRTSGIETRGRGVTTQGSLNSRRTGRESYAERIDIWVNAGGMLMVLSKKCSSRRMKRTPNDCSSHRTPAPM